MDNNFDPGAPDGGDGMDMCEYVFNPMMRNFQAIQRLINHLRNRQDASCDDIQCFYDNNNNPLNNVNAQNNSIFNTFWSLFLVWALIAVILFVFRPQSMRKSKNEMKKSRNPNENATSAFSRSRFYDDDDDSSTIS